MSQTPDDDTDSEDSSFNQAQSRLRIAVHFLLLPAYLMIIAAYFTAKGSVRMINSVSEL